ncbi:hypothetical protein ABMA79_05660 [Halobacteriovorax sp. HFRX-2_2]|uniref:hypothetical protein n=1 Tax=unclassified Halobacteriovorax TaxID=2639665 RepID=UPI003720596B
MSRLKTLTIILITSMSFAAKQPQTSNVPAPEEVVQDSSSGVYSKFKYFLRDHLSKENINRKLIDAFNSLKINLDVDIFKINIADGLSLRGKYEYEVEKSYIQGNYTRRDQFNFRIHHDTKNAFFPELQTPFFLKLDRNNEVVISRQFEKKTDAMKALPFNVAKIPIRSKYVDELNPGDFISIPASMALTTGFSYNNAIPLLNTGLSGFYTMAGDFLIQVYKLEDQKVRVKIIAQKKKTSGLSFKSRFAIELVSFEILGQEVDYEYKLDWFKLDASRTKGNIILADYVFNLKDDEVRKVYDRLFNNVFKFKEAKLFAESLNSDLLDKYYVVNLEDVDRIARVDEGQESPRVERVFKGHNRYKSKSSGIQLNLDILKLSAKSHYVNNRFNFERLDGSTVAFYYPNYTKTKESKISIEIFDTKEKEILSYFGLTSSHSDHKFLNVGMNFNRIDNEFRRLEQRRYLRILKGILPSLIRDEVIARIPKEKRYVNFNSRVTMILKKEAFSYLNKIPFEEFRYRLAEHLRGKRVIRSTSHDKDSRLHPFDVPEDEYQRKTKKLAKYFYDIIHSDMPYNEKVDKFTSKLRRMNNEQYIMQLLVELLPKDDIEKYLYLDVYIVDDSETLVDLRIGTNNYQEIYNQLEYLNRYIRGTGEDLRIDDRVDRIEDIQELN